MSSRLLLGFLTVWAAAAQTYTISTVVGTGLPSHLAATSANLPLGVPQFLTSDSAGNLYFVDNDSVIGMNAATGILSVAAGTENSGYSGDNGPATSALLNGPAGLAVDAAGDLYIADENNHVIRKVSQGTISTVAGSGATTAKCLSGPATSTALGFPRALALDSEGNLYFSDSRTSCVLKLSQGMLTVVAGNGVSGYAGDGGPATSASLSNPSGIAVDVSGNLYIADTGNSVVREVTASTGQINTIAGNGKCCTFTGYSGSATQAELDSPFDVALDASQNLYVSDSGGSAVIKITNGTITTVAGYGGVGFNGDNVPSSTSKLNSPQDIAFDSAGNLYIADGGNQRVRKVSAGVITTVAGTGSNGDGGLATQAILAGPLGVALDSANNLFIADSLVRKVNGATGIITTIAGNGGGANFKSVTSGAPATSVTLVYPKGIGVDGNDDVYVDDASAGDIYKVSGGLIDIVAGIGRLGTNNENGPALSAEYAGPAGMAVDSFGDIYFADFSTSISPLGVSSVVVSHIIEVSNGLSSVVAGTSVPGTAGDNGLAINAQLNAPADVALDSAGNLYIADSFNNRIRKITAKTGIITTVAGNGQMGSGGDGGPATSAQLNIPNSVAVDSAGNIYIADTFNSRIRKVNASTGIITTLAGNGQLGFSGDYGPATSAEIGSPVGIVVDPNGNVFFADSARVRMLSPSTGSSCSYSVTPATLQPPAAGGNDVFTVQTTAYCQWSVTGLPAWISVSDNTNGTGPGIATLAIAANTGGGRSATITVAGQTITLTQAGTGGGPIITLVANAEGEAPTIAPNTWVEIKGVGLAPPGDSRPWALSDFVNGQLPVNLDGVSVTVNGQPAYIYYISPTQINVLTPPGQLSGTVQVVATYGGPSAPFPVAAQAESPSFFVFGGGPYVAATHLNGSLIGPTSLYPGSSTPALPGETVVIYGNGFGVTSTAVTAGAESQSGTLSPVPAITIGGVAASVQFAGLNVTPGEFQFNVVVPSTLSGGDQPIVATYNGLSTQVGTLLTVQ